MSLETKIKKYFSDATARVSAINPLYAVVETSLMGLSPEVSIRAKFVGSALNFMGLSPLYSYGRDLSRKALKLDENTSELKNSLFDAVYGFCFSLLASPVSYALSGSQTPEELLKTGLISGVLNTPMGMIAGYSIDLYRDLLGIEDSKRIPLKIRNQKPLCKKAIAAGLTLGSIALTSAYYKALNFF